MKRLDAVNDKRQLARTHQIWKPRLGRDLTDESARQLIDSVTGFFGMLAEWSRAEKLAAADESAVPTSNDSKVRHDR